MFGPEGNPTAENLLGVIGALQEENGIGEIRADAEVTVIQERATTRVAPYRRSGTAPIVVGAPLAGRPSVIQNPQIPLYSLR